jgi:3-oxoacyl-[acyl-carrier protein] reductase
MTASRSTPAPLAGRVALVTGVSRRIAIGAAIARRLAADGAAVVLHSWSPHDAEQPWGADPGGPESVVAEITAAGGRAQHVAADLADPDAPDRLVAAAREAFGHVDILLANHARSSEQTLEQLTAAELDLTYAVNTRASLLLAKAFAAQHDGRRGGRILFFTSGQYHGAMPAELPYIASKGALHQVTRSVAVHLMPRGITVNCVDPGPNDTGYADEPTRVAVAAANPGGRWGLPTDTARLVAWLVSDEADWVTGQVIASDGGWSSRA